MQGNESLAAHIETKQMSRPSAAESALITLERSQKLDLLIHLISNLRQSLVICGPYGIGKTTLLNELEVRKQDLWSMVTIQASSNLSLESVQHELFRFLKQKNPEHENQDLSSILAVLDKQNQKIVVIIDDAGAVIPGVITNLIQYAAVNLCLRIVFSLTLDELHLLNSSDSLINDCHFIEIPSLTEKQCGLFLQQLSGQPEVGVSYNAINDRMIEKLYQETHGIPGRIVSELPKLFNNSAGVSNKWLSFFVISASVAIGISIFISAEPDKRLHTDEAKTAVVFQKAEVFEISSPVIYPEIKDDVSKAALERSEEAKGVDIIPVQPVIKIAENNSLLVEDAKKIDSEKDLLPQHDLKQETLAQNEGLKKEIVKKIEKNSGETDKEVTVAEVTVKKVTVPEKVTDSSIINQKPIQLEENKVDEVKNSNQWVLAQSEKNYTIQLMVLSGRESVLGFFKKNKSLKESLRFYQVNKQGRKKYVLIYGTFKNYAIATKKMKSLPTKYRKSWVRSFKILQKEIKQ
jgi:DamX protein